MAHRGGRGEGGRSDQKVKEIGKRGRQEFSIPGNVINVRVVPESANNSDEAGERARHRRRTKREEHTMYQIHAHAFCVARARGTAILRHRAQR
jgi:hypothetical protein